MATATLAGAPVERGTLLIPRAGVPVADVRVASEVELSGDVELVFGGLTLAMHVVSGDVFTSRGWYRLVGGKGGLRVDVPARSYRAEGGVKRSTVLRALAADCGETITLPATESKLGPAFVRPAEEASRTLDAVAPDGWYVDEAGAVQIGARAAATFTAAYSLIDRRPDLGLLTVAAEDLSALLPGAIVEGVEAGSVRHELGPDSVRSHIWTVREERADAGAATFAALVRAFTRETFFHAVYEYRVISVAGGYLDLRPMRSARGLPDLSNVPMRSGSPGAAGTPVAGSSVLVGFLDGDPTRPAVLSYEGPAGSAHSPADVTISADGAVTVGGTELTSTINSAGRFVRYGDPIIFSAPGPGTVTLPGASVISLVGSG